MVIIGGGLVGASLGVALGPADRKILLIESVAHQSAQQPSYDERTVALTYSAKRIYSAMGIWQEIESRQAQPILDIHISNQGHFGQTHLSHKDAGTDALGYVVPTRVLGDVLWRQLKMDGNTEIACPARANNLHQRDNYCLVDICQGKNTRRIKTALVVLADGGRSALARQINSAAISMDYAQSAVLSIVTTDRPHRGRAYERFTKEGPLALLPHSTASAGKIDQRFAAVWTTRQENLQTRIALSDDDFIAALQHCFGDRAGNFSHPSARKIYPLKRALLPEPGNNRIIVIGNAAHTVHPVAGQGFNLGLRDVAHLAELIFSHTPSGADSEFGNQSMINAYARSRKRDTEMVTCFTHSLVEIFSNDFKALGFARNLGLTTIEHFPPAKRFLLKRTMGLAGRQSRLEAGIPLGKQQTGKPQTKDYAKG